MSVNFGQKLLAVCKNILIQIITATFAISGGNPKKLIFPLAANNSHGFRFVPGNSSHLDRINAG